VKERAMQSIEVVRLWAEAFVDSWRTRRGEEGGMLDDVALMGALAAAAVLIGIAVTAFLTGKVNSIPIGW
jgi:allantoicase